MSLATVCFSVYSDISKRTSWMPNSWASTRQTSVLPTPVGPTKRSEAMGFLVIKQAGLAHLHGFDHLTHGMVLSVDLCGDALVERFEVLAVLLVQRLGVDLADTGQHIVDEVAIDPLRLLRHHLAFEFAHQGMQFAVGTGFVDEVDGLVGQEAVADVLGTQPQRRSASLPRRTCTRWNSSYIGLSPSRIWMVSSIPKVRGYRSSGIAAPCLAIFCMYCCTPGRWWNR